MNDSNPFKSTNISSPSDEVKAFHNRDDVDANEQAHHHTLGKNVGQAASGSEFAALIQAVKDGAFGRVGDYQFNDTGVETAIWKKANGQLLQISDYPEAFALYGTTHGGDGVTTFALPNVQGRVLAMKGGITLNGAVGSNAGAESIQLDHTHTTPNHNHAKGTLAANGTGAGHTHSIPGQPNVGNGTAASGSGVNVIRPSEFNGHAHGGDTGSAGSSHTHGIDGSTADAAPSTNGTTYGHPSFGGLFGNDFFSTLQPTKISICYVRVKLGF